MELNRTALKGEAKRLFTSTNPSPLLVGFVYFLIVYVLGLLSSRLIGVQVNMNEYYNAMTSGDYAYFERLVQSYDPGMGAWLIDTAIQIMVLILGAGFTIYVLNAVRHYVCSFGNIFDGFGVFFRVLWLTILTGIFVFLWSLLLIVPGIIAAYRYRMALYLLLDNPRMSPYQCISESKRMMTGHKWELCVLDMSFIGWYLLGIVPFVNIWVVPYTQLTYAVYYDNLRGMLGYARPAGEPAPDPGRPDGM